MINKIITIKNIGRFKKYSAKGDMSLKKLVLLFAENGRGKTTFCSILRSLKTGCSNYILERKSVETPEQAQTEMFIDRNKYSFANNSWSNTYPDIEIFDSCFVHNNVYTGDSIEHYHKKNLYKIIIGEGAQYARQIDEIASKIRALNTEKTNLTNRLNQYLPMNVQLTEYLNWKPINNIDELIQQKNNELLKQNSILANKSKILNKDLLKQIILPKFPNEILDIISQQFSDIIENADQHVRKQLETYHMDNNGENWLYQGLHFIENDRCPFCGQDVADNILISSYRSYFNDAYKKLIQDIQSLDYIIEKEIGEDSLIEIYQLLNKNKAVMDFWKNYLNISLPDYEDKKIFEKYHQLKRQAISLIQRKQQYPTESIEPNTTFNISLKEIIELSSFEHIYNGAVDLINTEINKFKTNLQRDEKVNQLKQELEFLNYNKKRLEPEIVQLCLAYQSNITKKSRLEKEKRTRKAKLDKYCNKIIDNFEKSINYYLEQFNTGFRLTNSRHNYYGGTPSSHFHIKIENTPIDIGNTKIQEGRPSFKTTLSSGDRSALALAFFLASLAQNPKKQDKIVVFDDPFTSLDQFRRVCTQQIIRKITEHVKQVIVMSHDASFLKLIYDSGNINETKTLQLTPHKNSTSLCNWDIEVETQSSYIKHFDTLLKYSRSYEGEPRNVVISIRPFLEGLFRVRFPGYFQEGEWLGNFIEKVRQASDDCGLYEIKEYLEEIENINDYSKKYHHDQNPNYHIETISEDELKGFVRRTLRFVGEV